MSRSTARTALLTALSAAILPLTACSSDDPSPGAASSTSQQAGFNDADVAFAQGMLPHHQQAVQMAQLADGRTQDAAVLDLARRVEAAQGPEITTLTGWLDDWGADRPPAGMAHAGHDAGMMSEEDMATLTAASGAEFDRLFLEQMIEHHTGAVGMAETEVAEGRAPDVIAMAEDIRSSQSTEIAEMEQLLGQ